MFKILKYEGGEILSGYISDKKEASIYRYISLPFHDK